MFRDPRCRFFFLVSLFSLYYTAPAWPRCAHQEKKAARWQAQLTDVMTLFLYEEVIFFVLKTRCSFIICIMIVVVFACFSEAGRDDSHLHSFQCRIMISDTVHVFRIQFGAMDIILTPSCFSLLDECENFGPKLSNQPKMGDSMLFTTNDFFFIFHCVESSWCTIFHLTCLFVLVLGE